MLLQTKLYSPPPRPGSVSRPRLSYRLSRGLASRLTLVSAPAGFGKTTLVAQWLHQPAAAQQASVAWLALDNYDDDPNRFWQYVVAALQTAVPHLGTATLPVLATNPLPPPPLLLTGLLNELADLSQPIVLVLDDYHLISDPAIHTGLDFLLEHAPPPLRLVLLTRADPPLALARLRGRGLLYEIRAADLRFTAAETAVFLRDVMGLTLSDADVAALDNRTEGWITGLHLTALSLQGRADASRFVHDFSHSHHYILDYLTAEVLQQQSEDMQTFLLHTAILPRLSGPLCDAVTQRRDSHAILAQLHRQNLFITSLDGHEWYRYHHLLADLLTNRLRQSTPAVTIRGLHERASAWCAAQGQWETAVSHAIAADNWELVADLVARAYRPLIAQGRVATWQRWLARIPAAQMQARPALLARQGWAAFLKGDIKQAEMVLATAQAALQNADSIPEENMLRGELATYLAIIAFFREDAARVIAAAADALVALPPDALTARTRATSALGLGHSLAGETVQAMQQFQKAVVLARLAGNPFIEAHALETVADVQHQTGQLRAAAATCRDIIALGTRDRTAPLPFVGNGRVRLAAVYLEWGELAAAEAELAAGMALTQQGGIGYNALAELCTQVRLRQALGDEEGALAALHQAESLRRYNPSRSAAVQLAECAVRFWLQAGQVETAVAWADGRSLSVSDWPLSDLPIIAQEVQQVTWACIALAQARPDDVLTIYSRVEGQARTAGRLARLIEIGLLAALAHEMKGETAVALDTLGQIIALTQPEGYVQIFVESGAPMLHLLRQLAANQHAPYLQTLIAAFPAALQGATAGLVESLSPRELEVLRLIAVGLSNKQITTELTVSLNTVKKHTSHIYDKLGVNGRTQAIARARELNLL